METIFTGMSTTGEIITQFPKASQILDKLRIDICHSENRPIFETLKANNIDEQEVLSRINQLYKESQEYKVQRNDWSTYSFTELINYIVDTHHSYLYRALPELSSLTGKILRLHGVNHPELEQVYYLFNDLKVEIEQHIIQEEEVVFPLIKKFEQQPSRNEREEVKEIFFNMENEHLTNIEILSTIREVTNNYQIPNDACLNYQLTYLKLKELEADLMDHIYLENEVLLGKLNKIL